jgi:hypothetical protein
LKLHGGSLFVASLFAAAAEAQAPVRYVQASLVNLRAGPSSTAAVTDVLVTNTEVEVLGQSGNWCDVQVRARGKRGFVACGLLASDRLTLETIDGHLRGGMLSPRERLDWASRGFWVAPSLSRWFEVGEALTRSQLTPEIEAREVQERTELRQRMPEFEAMKQTLARGITVAVPPVPVTEMGGAAGSLASPELLPPASPSYFRGTDVLLAIPRVPFELQDARRLAAPLADALSAFHGIPLQVRVTRRAYLVHVGGGADYDTIAGLWDVGAIEVSFYGDALVHGITSAGEVGSVAVQSMIYDFEPERCVRSSLRIDTRPASGEIGSSDRLVAWAWRSAIASWVGKPPVPGKASVKTRKLAGKTAYDALVIYDVDLDGDGVTDLSSWAGRYEPQVGAEGYWNAIFGNVEGEWVRLAYDADDDCT